MHISPVAKKRRKREKKEKKQLDGAYLNFAEINKKILHLLHETLANI